MGMVAEFKDLSPWAEEFLRRGQWLVEAFVCWRNPLNAINPIERHLPPEQRAQLRSHLARAFPADREDCALGMQERRRPDDVNRVRGWLPQLKAEWERPYLDIDKTWRTIVANLGEVSAARAIVGGEAVGVDIAYGPARIFSAAEVAALAEELSAAVSNYAAVHEDGAVEFTAVGEYYAKAAVAGMSMLAWLT